MKFGKFIFLFFPTMAFANDFTWQERNVGIMYLTETQYFGSNRYVSYMFPALDLQYGPLFLSIKQGAGIYIPLNQSRSFIVAPALRWRPKRNLGDPLGIIGYIKNIRPTATVNTIYRTGQFTFNFRITDGLTNDDRGSMYNLGIAWTDDVAAKTNLTLYATAIYGSASYNQTYFGITKSESAKYGFAEHRPVAGMRSFDIGAVLKHKLSDEVSVDFMAEYLRLVGAAAHSPITQTSDQFLFTIGATYYF